MTNMDIAPPDEARKICRVKMLIFLPNVVSIVDSNVSIDTHADAKLIDFEAKYTGLLFLRYLTILIMASVKEVKV